MSAEKVVWQGSLKITIAYGYKNSTLIGPETKRLEGEEFLETLLLDLCVPPCFGS